jgi:peptidase E
MSDAIVPIGGGELGRRPTAASDREVIRPSGKKQRELLFYKAASGDSKDCWKHVKKYLATLLKCKADVLLIKGQPGDEQIRRKMKSAEVIAVGGENALPMLRLWRHLGVDKLQKLGLSKWKCTCPD